MPRYYLNIRNDWELDEDADADGGVYSSLVEAHDEAILSARQIMSECIRFGKPLRRSRFEIVDEDGRVALVMPFEEALVGVWW
jgi:hypothetical protein